MIPQKAILFSGTVKDNIKYGNENLTDEEINKILEIAQSKDFVLELPDKLEAPVSQRRQ